MGWFNRKKESDYFRRQTYIMSNLGLFYIIILALFAVPLVGTFVVVLIKGVIDLRFIIVPGAILASGLILFILLRRIRRWIHRMRQDGRSVMNAARNQNQGGQAVQISIFNGLFALTLGTPQASSALPPGTASKQLPEPFKEVREAEDNVLIQIKELISLREAGEIDDQEFELLKAQLITPSCRLKAQQQKP